MKTMLTNQSISWLSEQNNFGNLVIKPYYQRKPVWSLRHKVYFIDTILRGLPIPKLYIYQKISKTKKNLKTKYEIVDGQQRIRAILEYLQGDFRYSKKYHPKPEDFLEEYEDETFQDLPSEIQQNFLGYELPVQIINRVAEGEINNMYIRLNLNTINLNKQEIRNAMFTGDFKKLVDSLVKNTFWSDEKIISKGAIRRMQDAEYISELLMSMLWGPQDKKKTLDECYSNNETMDVSQKKILRNGFIYIIRKIKEIFPDLKSTRFKNKSDFYSLFYLLFDLKKLGFRFPSDIKPIRDSLIEVHKSASLGLDSPDPIMRKYYEGCVNSPDSLRNRKYRVDILMGLLRPLFIETDDRRFFTKEQKQFIWHNVAKKVCKICDKTIKKYDDYEPDHVIPWSKGGHTSITNAQLVHKECNRKKGNRV